ncbi:surfeit locus protein 6-domain-containing protein [Immersiella caudata]|uniref:Surfeit locus protein 6-domain-containing protein n=1 Tax=Immersiella caudata TaxID=314043 RepID=A0AA39U5P5_9PEZI|nr:surfeit locus protein 6-domain-containing protein [Immersiella caudata]
MADTSLQDRLRDHAKAFDGLLSLIPAKMYYGEEKNDQWMKKKQTKDQAKAAKRGKLDPDSELNRSAKEELEERARHKRKLRELEAEDEGSGSDDDDMEMGVLAGVEKEKPLEGLKIKKSKEPASEEDEPSPPKKARMDQENATTDAAAATPNKKLTKEERKLAKKQKVVEEAAVEETATYATPNPKKMSKEERKSAKKAKMEEKIKAKLEDTQVPEVADSMEIDEAGNGDDMAPIDVSGLVADAAEGVSPKSTDESTPTSPTFDRNTDAKAGDAASVSTSVSSAIPPAEKPRYIKLPADTTNLRARLEAKLELLRAQRKSKDEEGQQIRTRADLIEARRAKQLQRRAHKREMRKKAQEEEDRKREEALTSSRNSPMNMLSPMLNDPDDGRSANHFAFGRLAFSDGTQMSHDLSYEKSAERKKMPSDPKTALAKLEAQKKRLTGLDEDKRKEVLEKETWLAARRRAEGEKVHDNEALLKKAIKRKEKTKKKSEREWKERKQGVEKGIKDRQRKREENLRKRREEKGSKGKKKGGPTKPKNRPGFEGGFGSGKKK